MKFFMVWVMAILLLLTVPCFAETYQWQDYRRPYTEEINLSAPAAVEVSLPAELLNSRREIYLLVDVMLTTGYGKIYVAVNDADGPKRLISDGESGETVLQIPSDAFEPGENTLFFIDERGFAGNILRRLAIRLSSENEDQASGRDQGPAAVEPQKFQNESIPAVPEDKKFSIAVIQFNSLKTEDADKSLGPMISEMFTTGMVKTQAYKIIEREQLNKVLGELSLAQTGVLQSGDVQRVGKILGIDAIVTGSVVKIEQMIRIDARIIDVGNGMILAAESRVIPFELKALAAGVDEMILEMVGKHYAMIHP